MKIPEGDDTVSLCITDASSLLKIKNEFSPTHVIHGAGVCDLDVCEERPLWTHRMNTIGARNITDIFGDSAYIVFLSSDLVFSGNNPPHSGYKEDDIPDPVSVAGKTIANAENEIRRCKRYCIVRLGLPIGDSVTGTKGAKDFIAYRLRRNLPLTLFHDEFRSCIGCEDIARSIDVILEHEIRGIYHLGGPKPVSLYNIGKWVLDNGGYDSLLLKSISRFEERDGPPRIGNVMIDSSKIYKILPFRIESPV